ncbi:MAG TPA: hypothetical protein PKE47_10590 [Verrucomicrobiota bacterium]|nr:hypothetical protein [Verrucomicrobiota bacterium]
MQATRILPDLQCSLVCDDVRQEATGNLILIGVISVVRVPQTPITASRLLVVDRWCAGVGQFTETVRLMAPDGVTAVREAKVKFALQDPNQNTTNVTFFQNIEFKTPGTYSVEVLVDDVMKIRYPLPIVQVQAPQQPGQRPPAAPSDPVEE